MATGHRPRGFADLRGRTDGVGRLPGWLRWPLYYLVYTLFCVLMLAGTGLIIAWEVGWLERALGMEAIGAGGLLILACFAVVPIARWLADGGTLRSTLGWLGGRYVDQIRMRWPFRRGRP